MSRFRLVAICALLVLFLSLTACQSAAPQQAEPGPVTLKVVSLPFLSFGPFYIGVEEGYFAEQAIELEFVQLEESADAYPLLAQGKIDVSSGFGSGYFNLIAQGSPLRVVAGKGYMAAGGCAVNAYVARKELVESGELVDAADLQGLTVSYQIGTMEEYMMEQLLVPAGLTIDDIEGTDVPAPAEIDALSGGGIDLTFEAEPWVTRIVNSGAGVVWKTGPEVAPDFQTAVILYGPSLLDDNPDAGQRFMVAYLKAVRQFNEGPTPRNLEIMAEVTGLEEELLKQVCWSAFHDTGEVSMQTLLDFQTWAVEKGYQDSVIPEEEFWDPSFIEYAAGELD